MAVLELFASLINDVRFFTSLGPNNSKTNVVSLPHIRVLPLLLLFK